MSQITAIQKILQVPQDSIWGPKSQAALIAAKGSQKSLIQGILKVPMDGVWGPVSQTALNFAAAMQRPMVACDASSFADPADVAAFNRCKLTGKTDLQCFAVGDNGIGQFGKITAQEHTPMVAVHGSLMKARWGSIRAAAHRPVVVTVKGRTIHATVEDRISAPGRIDLNPAAAKQLGLRPPFVVPCTWQWD
jgi:hypothetical protein